MRFNWKTKRKEHCAQGKTEEVFYSSDSCQGSLVPSGLLTLTPFVEHGGVPIPLNCGDSRQGPELMGELSGEGRNIMLEGELLETMQKQWERRIVVNVRGQSPTLLCSYVFHRNGRPIQDFSDSWETACKVTGLTGRLFHDFPTDDRKKHDPGRDP